MAWRYRDLTRFPARFARAMNEAVLNLNNPILFDHYGSSRSAMAVANDIRWFRWCIREVPSANYDLARLEGLYDFRTSMEQTSGRTMLYLTAKATKLSELETLNPHLAELIAIECQQENLPASD